MVLRENGLGRSRVRELAIVLVAVIAVVVIAAAMRGGMISPPAGPTIGAETAAS